MEDKPFTERSDVPHKPIHKQHAPALVKSTTPVRWYGLFLSLMKGASSICRAVSFFNPEKRAEEKAADPLGNLKGTTSSWIVRTYLLMAILIRSLSTW
jgi:hypothetical protein